LKKWRSADEDIFEIGIAAEGLEDPLPDPLLSPARGSTATGKNSNVIAPLSRIIQPSSLKLMLNPSAV
jgi:hypothetical protein